MKGVQVTDILPSPLYISIGLKAMVVIFATCLHRKNDMKPTGGRPRTGDWTACDRKTRMWKAGCCAHFRCCDIQCSTIDYKQQQPKSRTYGTYIITNN